MNLERKLLLQRLEAINADIDRHEAMADQLKVKREELRALLHKAESSEPTLAMNRGTA